MSSASVAPAVKQILTDTKSAISQAAVVAPEAAPVLNQVRAGKFSGRAVVRVQGGF